MRAKIIKVSGLPRFKPSSRENRVFERAAARLRRAKNRGFNKEIGKSRSFGRTSPGPKKRQARKS